MAKSKFGPTSNRNVVEGPEVSSSREDSHQQPRAEAILFRPIRIHSYCERLVAVIAAQGGHSRY